MLNMIRQFTFHKPREILQPTLWLFLSQACSMLSAILAYMAIYTLGRRLCRPIPWTCPGSLPLRLWALGASYCSMRWS